MNNLKFLLPITAILLCYNTSFAQPKEKDYANLLQQELGGQREYPVTSGYIDLLTETHAIEIEFAHKWKQSIGQALWYGQQTIQQPAIILILRKKADYKYFIQLNTALDYGGLTEKIKVWLYPNDFPNLSFSSFDDSLGKYENPKKGEETPLPLINTGSFWLTKSSGIRHNSGCRYYENTRGSNCEATEGRACKKCGG